VSRYMAACSTRVLLGSSICSLAEVRPVEVSWYRDDGRVGGHPGELKRQKRSGVEVEGTPGNGR
jgi:hypothetical protein